MMLMVCASCFMTLTTCVSIEIFLALHYLFRACNTTKKQTYRANIVCKSNDYKTKIETDKVVQVSLASVTRTEKSCV